MKTIRGNRVFQILYPLFVYYILYNVASYGYNLLFNEGQSSIEGILVAGLITIYPEYLIFKKVPRIYSDTHLFHNLLKNVIYIIVTVAIGIGLNVILTQTNLVTVSRSFTKTATVLTTGTIIIKILSNAIVIPLLEELVFRGIILGQLSVMKNNAFAVVFSAFCFGILHFNIVQFLYAFIVGLMLGFTYVRTKQLWTVVVAHGLINLIVIIFA